MHNYIYLVLKISRRPWLQRWYTVLCCDCVSSYIIYFTETFFLLGIVHFHANNATFLIAQQNADKCLIHNENLYGWMYIQYKVYNTCKCMQLMVCLMSWPVCWLLSILIKHIIWINVVHLLPKDISKNYWTQKDSLRNLSHSKPLYQFVCSFLYNPHFTLPYKRYIHRRTGLYVRRGWILSNI